MDFNFTDEQQQFRDALRRYLDNEYTFDARQKIVASREGVDAKHWTAFTELGLTALPAPEAQGGFDGGPADMLVVMQELGRALVVEPYWATAVGIEALRLVGDDHANALLKRAAGGEIKLAVAFHEPHARYDLFSVDTTAQEKGDGFVLSGQKSLVLHGAQAHYWIVPARLGGEIALFAVARDAVNVDVTEYRTIDGQRAATITFTATLAERLGKANTGAATLERIGDYATFLLCAEAVGVLDALNHATVEYTKERKQFGTPIARFQALQHRMVEMLIHAEQARSITYLAAARYTSDDADERRRAISAAKARVGQAARFVGQQAVQLHGGMGVTNEVAAAHWFKRLSIIETTLGDVDHHLARFASLPGFADTDV
ncbi:acyl-CoA dehydrogenase family protein [Caballeronia sordidicola]|jgi:alkylation response protein AidB-like acyl-CoA dehydrogenase|uniref:Putative pimeloyl-CoA dehydrogenase (Small subunit), PimD n=1 Tax=Caballeronia sordidicola TaxID=196367 RepID=A0A226WQ93_CABSO|nr:acyl-CoA dehydrogenase [Caballeronia sordidicola]OXC73361.1 putative pimeloyl-CoA dehydrogenase (Small subunit), PimD [Caballeronia sordidicola]